MSQKEQSDALESEWSHFIAAEDIEDRPVHFDITPDDEEKKRLARRMGILAVRDVQAHLDVSRTQGGMVIHVKGSFEAEVEQSCVVTLEPVRSGITKEFEAWYADPEQAVLLTKVRHDRDKKGERPVLSEKDDPEPIIGGKIDLGELVTQYISLNINPYPHAEGVGFDEITAGEQDSGESGVLKNPFAALKEWKDRQR